MDYEEELAKAEKQLDSAVAQHEKVIEMATTNHAEAGLKEWYQKRAALTHERIDQILSRVLSLKKLIQRTTKEQK
ncbi:hypothetical protein ACFOOP_02120 [Marinicaulis aureus]|uniref:Uncharacterized protein n=1 Tax=Hyphococcus aureus TaxID=2666033 RepID=A0ABW1KTT5_9PROT